MNCGGKCDKRHESQSNNTFVDTNANVLATYGKLLQREGFRVESAQDGLDALKGLSQLKPDLVVLELMLPTFDGAEVLKFIRADPRLKTVPAIIFTDASATELMQDAVLANGTQYMPKSDSTPADMLQAVQGTCWPPRRVVMPPRPPRPTWASKTDFAPAIKLHMAGPKTSDEEEEEEDVTEALGKTATTKERAEFLKESASGDHKGS